MNKRASFFFGLLFFLLIFITGVLIIPLMQDSISTARVGLNCSGVITSGMKITCLIVDSALPYWILLFISIGLGYFGGKFV